MELCVSHFVNEADVFPNVDEEVIKLLPKFLPKTFISMEFVAAKLRGKALDISRWAKLTK
jgi:hypothetical protein